MRNFERFSTTLAEDLPRLTAQLDRVLAQVDGVLGENRDNLKDSMANIRSVTERLQTSVDNLNDITGKIARGEGTIGKLVNSDEAHSELMSALGSVEKGVTALGDTLGRVEQVKLDIGLESAYLSELEDARSAFRLDVLPRGAESPRFYRVELVSDPRGRVTEKTETETVTRPDGTVETTTTARLVQEDRREVSALFGFPFQDARGRLWGGLIENSAGLQVDYGLVPEKLWLSLEAFDFSRELDLDPHLRLTASWYPLRNVYLRAGYDDPLAERYRSPFVGAGIRWSDDDLKYLLGSVPKF
jgi:phospholipid/cholesterol/gamma-HCH transport system substrate-binding protein